MVICDVTFDVTSVNSFGVLQTTPYKTKNIIDKCCVGSDCSTIPALFLFLSLSSGLPNSLKYNNIEIRPVNNTTMASKCLSEKMSLTSHFKSKT